MSQDLSNAIAIIGMAGRFPGAKDIDQFWENLKNGVESIRPFSKQELLDAHVDPIVMEHPNYVNMGAPFEDSDKFDAAFFGYLPKQAEKMDPQHRVLLELAWSAIEHAGYDPDRYPGLISVFSGIARNSYLTSNLLTHDELETTVGEYDMMIGNERDFPATRVAFKLNLRGPAINVTTACSTSGVAIHLACQSLISGDSDMAMAGAARVIVPRTAGYWYTEGGPLARDGHIRAFDANANGMLRGTGGAMIVLKRYEDAVADGDTIHALIRGSAVNNDGTDRIGYAAPSVTGQAACIADAHAISEVDADTITYIETHGTGTIVGDPIEVAGLTKAFRETTDKNQFCAIGSVKTNIGHLDAAATVAGVVKTALAMTHKILPPSLNYETPNPQIDFENSPFFVNAALREWQTDGFPRRAGVSSFGLGGTNAHIIMEEAPETAVSDLPTRDTQLLTLSAKTETALETATNNLADFLQQNPNVNLADVAFTLQNGRKPFPHRRILTADSVTDAIAALRDVKRQTTEKYNGSYRPIVFMFPGGGTQYAQMGRGLYKSEPVFRDTIDECAEILEDLIPVNLLDLIYEKADAEELKRPFLALPALLSVEIAMAHLWESWGLTPSAMIGHSMGEYAAAYMAGVFSLEDALALVTKRGELFEKLPAGTMLGVPLPEDELKPYINGRLDFAAINIPSMSVVSGEVEQIQQLKARLDAEDIDSRLIHINVAAHSRMVEPVLDEFAVFLDEIDFELPELPFVSNVTGDWISNDDAVRPGYWVEHLRSTVRFADGLTTLLENPNQILLEVGPGRALSTFARQHPKKGMETAVLVSLRHPREEITDLAFTLNSLGQLWLAGAEIDWQEFSADEERMRIPLPTYPFERKRYWREPVGPLMVSLNGTMPPELEDYPLVKTPAPITQNHKPDFSAQLPDSTTQFEVVKTEQEGEPAEIPQEPTMTKPAPRKERVLDELKEIIQNLSGIQVADLDSQATFLELGFDSLFLTQANLAFKKKFKVKLSVRQLLEKYSRLDALAAYIDETLPADAFPPPAPVVVAQSPEENQPLSNQPNAAMDMSAPKLSVPQSTIEKVIQDQLQTMQQLMAQQLAALSSGTVQQPSVSTQSAIPQPKPTNTNGTAHKVVPESASKPLVDKSSPWQPVQAGEDGKLPQKQQAHLEKLIETTIARSPKSKALAQKHRAHLADPRTVQGFNRAWKEMVFPIVADRSKGSKVWDVDGNEYIDLMGGYGVNLLGHSPDFISEAAKAQIDRGIEIGPQNKLAGEVAQMVCDMTGMDRAAMCNTGSEAILAAIRIARTVTGNDRIAMFKTHYHGIFNEVLAKGLEFGGKKKTMPIAPGIPGFAVENTLMLDYGEQKALDDIRAHADELALVMVESVRSRDPEKRPHEFIKALRALTDELGIPLMFDEIVTGFRAGPGGAQEYYGVQADLASYGKIIGGGYPIGVIAGKKEYMDALDGGFWQFGDGSAPEADMTWFAGTFVRHPLAMATAHATLTHLKENPNLQKELNEKTAVFAQTLNDYFKQTKAPIYITHFASWFMVKFKPYQEYSPLMFWHLRNRGILTYEGRPAFFTAAHTDEDFERTITAFKECAAEMQNNGFFPGGPVRDYNEPFDIPMTEGQQEIWLATQFGEDASRAFNLASTLRLQGDLQVDKLEEALLKLVQRHESLRAVPNENGLSQTVLPVQHYGLAKHDLSDFEDDAQTMRLDELMHAEVVTPFDLVNGPLTRATLIKLSDNDHFFLFTAHHLIADGWSCGVILKDLTKLYTAVSTNTPANLNDVMQLSEWANLQADAVTTEEHQDAKEYWLEAFAGDVPVLELPTDHPRPAVKTYPAKRTTVVVPKDEMAGYSKIASEQGVTLFTYLMGAFDVLLHRISGQNDIVVGFSLAGQSNLSGQDLVAHAVNFLPIRAKMQPDMPFADLLTLLRGKIFDAVEYQDYPFGALIKNLKIERDRSRLPLMSVAFNLDPSGSGVQIPGLDVETGSVPRQFENFDIFFNVAELADRYEIQVTANRDLFNPDTMERYVDAYLTILRAASRNAAQSIGSIPMLTQGVQDKILQEWNDTAVSYPDKLLTELFAEQVLRSPDAPALLFDDNVMTYGELDQKANQLAHYLQSNGVQPDSMVGVCMDRSFEMVIALYAILKAGGAYVPIDPTNPVDRIAFMVEDANVPLLLTQQKWLPMLNEMHIVSPVIAVDAETAVFAQQPTTAPVVNLSSDNLAYMIYTSGSTGKPKGAMNNHRGIVNRLLWMQDTYKIGSDDAVLQKTPYSFDVSVWEFFWPLFTGAKLVIAKPEGHKDPGYLADIIRTHQVTTMHFVPSMLQIFLTEPTVSQCTSLRRVICSGEALPADLQRRFFEKLPAELHNLYGPTEAAVDVTYWECDPEDARDFVPIGRPVANTQIYIVDKKNQPVPIGVPGELLIAGVQVARGYHNRPELNAERFVNLEIAGVGMRRVYRTGDSCRWLADGSIEFMGRLDFQVKLRGFRIELGEIESALTSETAVQEASVIVREDRPGQPEIAAYVVVDEDTDTSSDQHKTMWLEKWEVLYESSRTADGTNHADDDIITDVALLGQLADGEDVEMHKEAMREFQKQTIDRVMALNPKRVLEIGCGSGQNLVQIAPHVDYFLGTDIAPFAIRDLQAFLDRDSVDLPHVELDVREGNDFSGMEKDQFDTTLVLSVMQYFPDPDYFKQVIEGSLRVTKPGGVVYISDVQSLRICKHTTP
jgi:amino acid adenylation domain-containing protein